MPSLYEYMDKNLDFERGAENPYDTLDIGNRLARLKGLGKDLPLWKYFFEGQAEDFDMEDPGDAELFQEFEDTSEIWAQHTDFIAVVDYMREKEELENWGDIDEYGGMSDVITDLGDKEDFKGWAYDMINGIAETYEFDPAPYITEIDLLQK